RSPMVTVPRSANAKPAMTRNSVVLPEPDGPSSATSSPPATSNDAPRRAGAESKDSHTSSARRAKLSPQANCSAASTISRSRPFDSAMSTAMRAPRSNEAPLDQVLRHHRHEREQHQQRGEAERGD